MENMYLIVTCLSLLSLLQSQCSAKIDWVVCGSSNGKCVDQVLVDHNVRKCPDGKFPLTNNKQGNASVVYLLQQYFSRKLRFSSDSSAYTYNWRERNSNTMAFLINISAITVTLYSTVENKRRLPIEGCCDIPISESKCRYAKCFTKNVRAGIRLNGYFATSSKSVRQTTCAHYNNRKPLSHTCKLMQLSHGTFLRFDGPDIDVTDKARCKDDVAYTSPDEFERQRNSIINLTYFFTMDVELVRSNGTKLNYSMETIYKMDHFEKSGESIIFNKKHIYKVTKEIISRRGVAYSQITSSGNSTICHVIMRSEHSFPAFCFDKNTTSDVSNDSIVTQASAAALRDNMTIIFVVVGLIISVSLLAVVIVGLHRKCSKSISKIEADHTKRIKEVIKVTDAVKEYSWEDEHEVADPFDINDIDLSSPMLKDDESSPQVPCTMEITQACDTSQLRGNKRTERLDSGIGTAGWSEYDVDVTRDTSKVANNIGLDQENQKGTTNTHHESENEELLTDTCTSSKATSLTSQGSIDTWCESAGDFVQAKKDSGDVAKSSTEGKSSELISYVQKSFPGKANATGNHIMTCNVQPSVIFMNAVGNYSPVANFGHA